MYSRYFKSKKLKPLSERPEHIRLDGEVVIEGFKNQLFDLRGRATDKQIQELSKTHKITYDVVQQSNEDTTQTEVIIYKKL